ncbi:DUF433 domain-containing protein [Candidatus Entotheonella palauensis]|uniref:DUF433 domain-containing protein n=1 Tax=Candidatus Entotheonella gemina TaxID=1429439 RepID=W4LWB7_9BACT|nr:DUF433 domain-containing protein [Candidatus Entotheonella palauensis]ETX02394.1 MAG: hypothetical protein ETSY2_35645 [Candidatus Entotheonella gemina]
MQHINCANLTENIPLRTDAHGTIRVGNTRVTLSTVIASFDRGATPEAIVDSFNTLNLEDVYLVIGYYLRHRDEVKAYLKQEREEGEALRKSIEAELSPNPLRKRLLKQKYAHLIVPRKA